jgi:hypothetical protein
MDIRKKLAVIALAGSAVVAAGQAKADVIASTYLQISNLALLELTADGFVGATGVTILSGNRNGTISATFGSDDTGDVSQNLGPTAPLDIPLACAGDCPAPVPGADENSLDNELSFAAGSTGFAASDMTISGSAIAGDATGLTRADAKVVSGGAGIGNSEITNNVLASLTIEVLQEKTFAFVYDYEWMVRAFIDPVQFGLNPTADATSTFSIALIEAGQTDTIESVAYSTNAFPVPGANDFMFENDGTTLTDTRTLAAGTYNVVINQTSSVNVSTGVPAPGTLGLLSLSLLGLGAVARRRQRNAIA